MNSRSRVEMITLMAEELNFSVRWYLTVKERKNDTDPCGQKLDQPECKASLERKIITIREQLNQLRKEL